MNADERPRAKIVPQAGRGDLRFADQGTLAEAASLAGIGEATLRCWLQRDDFQVAYRRARRETVSEAVAHVQRVSGEAVDTLRTIMNDDQKLSSTRVTAARVILELSIKAVELEDLEVRIAALEALSAANGGAW